MWFRRKQPRIRSPYALETPLLFLSPEDPWTIGHSFENTAIFGSTGGGKSSSSAAHISIAFLAHGYGGLVLTCKPGELDTWRSYFRAVGRPEDDLLVIRPGGHKWNFLHYAAHHEGGGPGLIENLVALLMSALLVSERALSATPGSGQDPFWSRMTITCLRNLLTLAVMCGERLSISLLHDLLISAPQNQEQCSSESWRRKSACCRAIVAAESRSWPPLLAHDLKLTSEFWVTDWVNLASKTRSIVQSSVSSLTDVLGRGLLHETLCTETTVTPEAMLDGKVILVDLPIKIFGVVGLIAQTIIRRGFQRFAERRDIAKNPLPCFIFMDEAPNLVDEQDPLFLATSRSSRVANVLISQNIPAFEAVLGGADKGRALTASLLANCNTRLFHRNSCTQTNQHASELIGKSLMEFASSGQSFDPSEWHFTAAGLAQPYQATTSFSEHLEHTIPPWLFGSLRSGGPEYGFLVDAIVYQNGRLFQASGENHLFATFEQHR